MIEPVTSTTLLLEQVSRLLERGPRVLGTLILGLDELDQITHLCCDLEQLDLSMIVDVLEAGAGVSVVDIHDTLGAVVAHLLL